MAAPTSDGADLALPFRRAKDAVVARFERSYLGALIEQHKGNVSAAARAARGESAGGWANCGGGAPSKRATSA